MKFESNCEYAQLLDDHDELAKFRNEFFIADPEQIYLDGNSLGRLPKRTQNRILQLIQDEWGTNLIRNWNDSWFTLPERVGKKISHLVDADERDIILADSTSINLYKLAFAALRFHSSRTKIVTDELNFPSDIYILQNIVDLFGSDYQLKMVHSLDGLTIPISSLAREIDRQTALVCLSHTAFKSGFVYDMAEVTDLAHDSGAFVLWDVSHSVGAVPFSLRRNQIDMAVGCTYKYLNGGPGSPAFLYVSPKLQQKFKNPIPGWFGQKNPFHFDLNYEPVAGMRRFLTGTPAILSLAAIENGVELLLKAGMNKLRKKSVHQTQYLIFLWEQLLKPLGFLLNSPVDPEQRGSHVCFGHDEGFRIYRALIEDKKVIPDFRVPDNIRFGIASIYTSFNDVYQAVVRMKDIVDKRIFLNYSKSKPSVT